jgi:hypothetical protein
VFAIPTVFLEAVAGSLGLSAQLDDAVSFYNRITQDERAVVEESLNWLLFDTFGGVYKIKPLDMRTSPIL